MKRFREIGYAAACLLLALPAHAGELGDVIARALAANPQVKSVEAQADAAHYGAMEARGRMLPSATASYTAQHLKDAGTTSHTFNLSARQLVFNGGAALKDYKRARAEAKSAGERLREADQRIMQDAAAAYVRAAGSAVVLGLRQAYLDEVRKLLRGVQRRVEEGEGTRTDVDQVRAQVYDAEARHAAARGELEQTLAELEQIAGVRPGAFAVPAFPAALVPPSEAEMISIALQHNAAIAAAEQKLKAARHGVWAETAASGPSLYATADYGREYGGSFDSAEDETKIGLELNVPLFNGGRGYARHKAARAVEQQSFYDLTAQRDETIRVVKSASSAYRSARHRLEAARLAVNSAEATLKGMRIEFDQGERTLTDIISARRELLDRQVDWESAKQEHWESGLAILATLDRLSPGVFAAGAAPKAVAASAKVNIVPTAATPESVMRAAAPAKPVKVAVQQKKARKMSLAAKPQVRARSKAPPAQDGVITLRSSLE